MKPTKVSDKLNINIFSKHLQFLDFKALGEQTMEMGFNGVDLTVRPKGHVLPEHVFDVLPKAVEDIKKSGVACSMMTTAVNNADNQTDINVLKMALLITEPIGLNIPKKNLWKPA